MRPLVRGQALRCCAARHLASSRAIARNRSRTLVQAVTEPGAVQTDKQSESKNGDATDTNTVSVSDKKTADAGKSSNGTWPHMTKIICTIGPATASKESLLQLAANGMNTARLNMTHGDHKWHRQVIQHIREINREYGYSVAIMMDTEGSEVHLRAADPVKLSAGEEVTFSVRPAPAGCDAKFFEVSYEAFVDDVEVGDSIMVDGGMVILQVKSIAGPEVHAEVVEPGLVLSRANLTFRRRKELVRGRASMLPVVTAKDWQDIDFAIAEEVDFLAISFVKSADVIDNVRSYIRSQLERRKSEHTIDVIAKMEAYDSVANMSAIIAAADGIMVARSDLGAQIPFEDVPALQKEIVFRCRQMCKPVIVASQLLNSMIDVPVPTRAEVADCADGVRQQADALMLSGETAAGKHPVKAVQTLQKVCERVEEWCRSEKFGAMRYPKIASTDDGRVSEELCASAAILAESLSAAAIVVYTRRGIMAAYLSRRRPSCPILAVTDSESVKRRLGLRWGVMPFLMPLDENPDLNVEQTFEQMKAGKIVKSGDLVIVVSDIRPSNDVIRSVQVRHVR